MADAKKLEGLLRIPGGAMPEQIASCDFVVVRNVRSDRDFHRFTQLMHDINPGVKIYETKQAEDIYYQVYRKSPVNMIFNVFLGIMGKFDLVRSLKYQYKKDKKEPLV